MAVILTIALTIWFSFLLIKQFGESLGETIGLIGFILWWGSWLLGMFAVYYFPMKFLDYLIKQDSGLSALLALALIILMIFSGVFVFAFFRFLLLGGVEGSIEAIKKSVNE